MRTEGLKGALLSALIIASIIALAIPLLPTDRASALPEETKISIKVDFPAPEITKVGEYHRVTMSGLQSFGNPGEPILPLSTVRVLIPYEHEVKAVRVTHGRRVILDGSYYLEPAQRPIPLCFEGRVEPTPPDDSIYNSPSPFPTKIYSDPFAQSKRGYKILILNLYPVSYIPAERGLSYFKEMTVEVEIEPSVVPYHVGQRLSLRCSTEDRETISRIVDNPETIDTYPCSQEYTSEPLMGKSYLDPSQSYKYVIITNEVLQNVWEEEITNGSFANLASGWIFNGVDYDSTPTYLLGYTTNGHTSSYDHTGDGSGSIGVYAQPNWLATDTEEAYWTRSIDPIESGSEITVVGYYMHVSNVGDSELDEERIRIEVHEGSTWKTVADHTISGSHGVTNDVWYKLGPEKYTTQGQVDQIRVYLYCKDYEGVGGGEEHGIVFDDLSNPVKYTFQDLISRKEGREITATTKSVEWIYANYDGVDNQTKIRNFIIDAYNNWETEYVLLGGDDTVVPFRRFWVEAFDPDENEWFTANMPSDMYYSCLDGTFNYDNDGYWGEPNDGENGGEVDFYAEVYVGRAPVASGVDVSNFVRKTLAFEDFDPENRYLAYMVGEYLGWGGLMDYAKPSLEEIRLGSSAYGYTTEGFVSCGAIMADTLYEEDQSWSGDDLINIVNNGVRVLNHLGHGNPYIAMKLSNSDLDSLTNTEYFFAYSQTCSAGYFDGIECWAEKVVRMENGAAAVVMNARYGFGNADNTDGPSQHFAREFWDAAFGENKYNFGVMNSDSKEDQDWYISLSSRGRWCAYELNLFGDPELHFIPYLPAKVIVRGKDTAYSVNNTAPPPWKTYDRSSLPPLMVAKRVGSGAAIAAGFAPACRDGHWNIPENPDNHLPELLDASFQWMVPGATTVLWYEGYNALNNRGACGTLVEAVTNLGYTITGDSTEPITSSLLALYDIMIIPQLLLPYPPNPDYPSGNPDLLPDADVQAIKNFVEGGGGLLVMEATDFFDYKYSEVQNKILLALGFDYLFQDDSVYDDTNNIAGANYRAIADVDDTTEIGEAYCNLAGKTTIGLYGYASLAKAGAGVSVKVVSDYQVGMPGTTLEYTVVVFNPKNPAAENLMYDIIVTENADWSPSVSPASLSVPVGENGTATLSVTVPTGTPLSTEDEILVEAVAVGYPEVRDSFTCRAHAGLSIKPTMDAYISNEENDKAYGADNPLPLYTGRYGVYWQNTYLQFDLPYTIPSEASITDARLFLFCFNVYGTQVPIACTEVDDDDWDELTITWNNQPENGVILDQQLVRIGEEDFPISYSWDVTSFVDQEFQGDKIVSLCLRGLEDHPISVNESFESKDWPYEDRVQPILRVSYISPWTGAAIFSMENLYAVRLEKNLYLENGSKLVVKFYTYGDAFENENVIETFASPVHVKENESARHPEGIGVKKARLDLTYDNTEDVLATIASFTIQKVDLEVRFTEVPLEWSLASPAERVALEIEFAQIPLYWSLAPS